MYAEGPSSSRVELSASWVSLPLDPALASQQNRMSQQWQPRQQREQSYEQPIEYDGKSLLQQPPRRHNQLTLPFPSSVRQPQQSDREQAGKAEKRHGRTRRETARRHA